MVQLFGVKRLCAIFFVPVNWGDEHRGENEQTIIITITITPFYNPVRGH